MKALRTLALLAGVSLPALQQVSAQQATAKLPITQDVYDTWRSIQGTALSSDGRWVAYTLSPQVGDGELVVRATGAATEHRVPRGFTGRPQTQPNADSNFVAPPAQFTTDSRFVLVSTFAPKVDFDRARRTRRGRAAPDMPKSSLAILRLADGNVTSIPRVKSFRIPKYAGHWAAYLLEPDSAAAATDSTRQAGDTARATAAVPGGAPRPIADSTARGARKKEYGSTLVLRDLETGAETRIPDVMAYVFEDSGRVLGYTVSSRTAASDGAYLRTLASGATRALLSGAGEYRSLTFDRAGRQVAFIANRDEYASSKPRYSLYAAPIAGAARAIVPAAGAGDGLVIAERGRVEFSRDGSALAFGIVAAPLDSIPADSLADKAVFDLWNYKDPRLQPQQIVEARRDRDRSWTSVYQLGANRWTRIGSDTFPRVAVSDDGRIALAETSLPYSVEAMWGEGGSDVYVVDVARGTRTLVASKVLFGATLSPGGRYVLWFADGRWRAYDVRTRKTADLTGKLAGVKFEQETWDTPSTPAPWGVAGWTTGDRSVLLYDRFDIWEADPTGARVPQIVTDSAGRRDSLVFRVVDLDPEDRFIDPAAPLLLRTVNAHTKASGFYRDRLGDRQAPVRIVMADRQYGMPLKARAAHVYAVTQSTVRDFPNLWVGPTLDSLTRISDANPQQSRYRWPTVELVEWRSLDGTPLQGLLYKPEDFDSTKTYPMLVYFYEQLSDNLHGYVTPAGRNVINPTVYTSKGYLVFEPDIAYTTGYPGQSALHSIVPGVQALIARGFVDPKAIGAQGQSWGGYQTAYMITQTNIFRAAMAGAPVANMTSAYGGIRWESGLARAFQYEKTQSRIGGSIWEYPMRYIENSPLFFADRIQTPLFIMSNDGDGAVPWYQGIELFVALRRLGKEVYLVNYNGDGHNPRKRANQLDVDLRMQQFFDHFLRGGPTPDWMQRGIPYLQKGRDQLAPRPPVPPVPVAATTAPGRQ